MIEPSSFSSWRPSLIARGKLIFSKEENQKALNLDTACAMWELLLKDKWPLLNKWCDFLNRKHKKAISRDTWNQILDFSRMYNSSLFGYDAEGKDAAWPYLIDEFVEEQMENLKTGMKEGTK